MVNTLTPKNIYVVLGMARSGTSTVARSLKALGIELGENLEPPEATWNPKGFWEDVDIVYKVNRAVLFALNYTWMSVNRIDDACQQNADLIPIKKYAVDILKEKMAQSTHWGFKDPRTAKILPFWQEVFTELKLNEHYIIVSRNPLSAAFSYQRVSGCDIEVGLLLWLMHLIPAIEGSQGKKRVMVSYENLLQNPSYELKRLRERLKLQDLANEKNEQQFINQFLDKKLQHFSSDGEALANHPATQIVPLCIKMHDLFRELSTDAIDFNSQAFNEAWLTIKNEFNANYAYYCYLDVWLKRHKKLERELRSIKKSLPWKLLWPLRFIDDSLRSRRRKKREMRRLLKAI